MSDIRINSLPSEPNPSATDNLAIDGATTRRATAQAIVNAGAPVASQAEAQVGTDAVKRMTPLTTKQSIASEVGVTIAGPLGPNLTGIKALTTAANNVPIFTDGSGGSTTYTVSPFVQTASGAINSDTFFGAIGFVQTPTRTIAQALFIPADRKEIETLAYSAPGDAGGAIYARADSEPVDELNFRSLDRFLPNGVVDEDDGGWWRFIGDTPILQQAGAPHNGVNSDAPAMSKIAAQPRIDIVIKIPPGDTVLDQNIFVQDRSFSIEGEGSGVSRIRCTGEGGFKFLSTDTLETVSSAHRVNVRGVSIVCEEVHSAAGEGRTGFEAEWSYTGSGTIERIVLDDVVVRGGGAGKWWKKGIRLVDAAQVRACNLNIYNQDGHQTSLAEAGLEIVRDKATNITGFELVNLRSSRMQDAIRLSQKNASSGNGTIEGFTLTNGEAVNCAYAIHEDVDSGTGKYFDSISISNFHWNASRAGLKAGRVRGLTLQGNHLFHQNFGDSNPSPLEASINILLQLDGLRGGGNSFTRYNTVTDLAPALLLPDASSLNWAFIEDNQFANWRNLVESTGALTTAASKLFIGRNILISTPLLANYGFKGNQTTIGGNDNKANGETVTFPHQFSSPPAVVCMHRSANATVVVKPYNITANSFQVYTDFTPGTVQISWVAVGN